MSLCTPVYIPKTFLPPHEAPSGSQAKESAESSPKLHGLLVKSAIVTQAEFRLLTWIAKVISSRYNIRNKAARNSASRAGRGA